MTHIYNRLWCLQHIYTTLQDNQNAIEIQSRMIQILCHILYTFHFLEHLPDNHLLFLNFFSSPNQHKLE